MSTISTTISHGIQLGSPGYASPLTITTTGAVETSAASNDAIFGPSSGGPWTVVNEGTLEATGSASFSGIALFDGGHVSNTGVIIGTDDGIFMTGLPGTVSNSGTVEGLGSTPGIFLDDGGVVSNSGNVAGGGDGVIISGSAGSVSNLGTIEGGEAGIAVRLGAGTVTNSGTINGLTAWGIYLGDGGTVTNHGLIESTAHGAVSFHNTTGVAINFATIESSGNQGVYFQDGGSLTNSVGGCVSGGIDGVLVLSGAGTVTNSGTIHGMTELGIQLAQGGRIVNGSTRNTAALIEGGTSNAAIYVGGNNGTLSGAGATGTVTNFGTVENGTTLKSGVVLGEGGIVENIDSKALIAGGKNGVSTDATGGSGGPGTVVNSGKIEGMAGSGVFFGDGGSVTNSAGGLIEGVTGITVSAGNATVTNAGTVESTATNGVAISFAGGSTDLLVVDPGAVFDGTVLGPGGSGTLELADGTGGTLSGLGTQFQSFGTIKVDPKATWTLSGDGGASSFVNDGKILTAAGQTLVFGAVGEDTGQKGTIDVGKGGTAEFMGSVASGQSFAFSGTGGLLQLANPGASFAAAISGFKKGDLIELANTTANGHSFAKGKLTVTENGTTVRTLTFTGHYTASEFTLTQVGSNVDITIGPPPEGSATSNFVSAGNGSRGAGFGAGEPDAGGGTPVALPESAGGVSAPAGGGRTDGFVPFGGGAAAGPAAGVSDAGSPLPWATDPFHFWTIQG